MPDESVEIEISRFAGAQIQRIGGLEKEFVRKQAVQALTARKPDGHQYGLPQNQGDGCACDREGLGHVRQTWWMAIQKVWATQDPHVRKQWSNDQPCRN
ncbi:hypothetical protein D3C86_1793080 [compost metagenome]